MSAAGALDRARSSCDIWEATLASPPGLEPSQNLSTLERAIALAAEAHAGQKDKAGTPYILHPLRVMFAVEGDEARMAAVLHDVVEDGGVTLDQLRNLGFPETVVEAVDALTKRDSERGAENYLAFVERAGQNDIARAVKLADIADNMDLSRIARPTDEDLARMARYRKARRLLERMEREAELEALAALEFLQAVDAADTLSANPVILPLRATVSSDDIASACAGREAVIACDFYVSGAECGMPVPGGFILGRILNVDHHAPVERMRRPITSTALACEYLRARGAASPATHPAVVINHTDCDSVLSSALILGLLQPEESFVAASIAADHTGDADPVADLLQGMDEARNGDRTSEQYGESLRSLQLLLAGHRLPAASQRALDRRLARREAAAQLVTGRCFHLDGPLAWAELEDEIDAAFFPALLPSAALIMTAQRREDAPDRWNVKLRLGRAAPPGFTLRSLGIQHWNPGFGGRWNAGSNKRGRGTSIEPRDYANRLLAKLIPALTPG
jgi:hypothetical protein